MPPRIKYDLTIDKETGEWRRLEQDTDIVYKYRVEYSKSGRAACKKCSEKIPKGLIILVSNISVLSMVMVFLLIYSSFICYYS